MKLTVAFTTLLGAVAAAAPALADGGLYGGALGARGAGRSGAFVARADDPTAVAYNPAGIAKVDGTVVQLGNRLSNNGYAYTRAATTDWADPNAPTVSFPQVSNGTPWQAVEPLIAVASNLGLRDWGFALSLFPTPGAARAGFPESGGQRYMMRDRDAIILNYAATAAWKYHDLFGFGATLEWIHVPRLDYALMIDGEIAQGVAHPVSSPLDMRATTTGSDPFTFNAILGAWFRPAPFLELGLAGQVIPTSIATTSHLKVEPLDPNLDRIVLKRQGVDADDVNVIIPLPLMVRGGARYRHIAHGRELFDVELDVEYETWSRVKNFTVDTHNLDATILGREVPLGKIYVPKAWRNTVAVKLGGDVAVIPDRWTMRAGAFFETAVSDAAHSNVDFPGGKMMGGSLGTSILFGKFEVALAYQLRKMANVSVSEADGKVYQQVPASSCTVPPYDDPAACNEHYRGQPAPTVNAGRYAAISHYLLLAVLYRYGS